MSMLKKEKKHGKVEGNTTPEINDYDAPHIP
jgi:hypothetical protein